MPRRKKQGGIREKNTPCIVPEAIDFAEPRRSSRRSILNTKIRDIETLSDNSEAQAPPSQRGRKGSSMAPRIPDASSRNDGYDVNSDAELDSAFHTQPDGGDDSGTGVGKAIQRLSRLERQLQRNLKKEQLKVEKSVGSIDADVCEPATRRLPGPPTPKDIKGMSGAIVFRRTEIEKITRSRTPTPNRDLEEEDKRQRKFTAQEAADQAPVGAERGAARPPPVDSDYLPLPWTGRLGYACLNTYLRSAKPPVFSSRTCRMSSIIDHRWPLADPTQPEHPIKNRPDKTQKPDRNRGLVFLQQLGLANARDIAKMLRWNERYGIRFMRLSSEMFPFASHQEHGYKLVSFASEVLAEAGKVAAEFGHRLTTHPGQFTQLGSPRQEVIHASVRDLEYHDEMLSLLKLPEQQNRDAVMILHMGGVYGDKAATLDRFRHNYTTLLSDSVKQRLVLENDDVSWSVHDLLPICEELNIPMVLDFHHHNIIFDPEQVREGTADIVGLFPRIRATWDRKNIRMKMHYSEPCPGAVTPRDRRKHSPRVATLPPCPPDVDLMIEAKDKEQAVFELMRNFKLPGFERIRGLIPNERTDEARPKPPTPRAAKPKKSRPGKKKQRDEGEEADAVKTESGEDTNDEKEVAEGMGRDDAADQPQIPQEDIGMGGPDGRVYWPPGMEDWLRPLKRDQKRKVDEAMIAYDE